MLGLCSIRSSGQGWTACRQGIRRVRMAAPADALHPRRTPILSSYLHCQLGERWEIVGHFARVCQRVASVGAWVLAAPPRTQDASEQEKWSCQSLGQRKKKGLQSKEAQSRALHPRKRAACTGPSICSHGCRSKSKCSAAMPRILYPRKFDEILGQVWIPTIFRHPKERSTTIPFAGGRTGLCRHHSRCEHGRQTSRSAGSERHGVGLSGQTKQVAPPAQI